MSSSAVFYNPDLVAQLAACGITARRRTAAPGFVVDGRRNPRRAQEVVTNVIEVRSGVTITGPRQLPAGPTTATAPQNPIELVEECARLRRDNGRLLDEVARLRGEVDRLSGTVLSRSPELDLDDAATRFSLLELDL